MTEPRSRSCRSAVSRRAAHGFGLLEVLVALAVFAIAGTTLFDWINQSLRTVNRLDRIDAESRLLLDAQALAATIDPLRTPAGDMARGGLQLRWRSETAMALQTAAPGPEGLPRGNWLTGLSRLQVQARDERNGAEVSFSMLLPMQRLRPGVEAVRGADDAR